MNKSNDKNKNPSLNKISSRFSSYLFVEFSFISQTQKTDRRVDKKTIKAIFGLDFTTRQIPKKWNVKPEFFPRRLDFPQPSFFYFSFYFIFSHLLLLSSPIPLFIFVPRKNGNSSSCTPGAYFHSPRCFSSLSSHHAYIYIRVCVCVYIHTHNIFPIGILKI